MSEGKLKSLQGLRGVSIILVLAFHLYPKHFVNGFVGVDMFFVLSGFLMSRILSKGITLSSVLEFYKKRFCRIVPLYYLTIFSTIFAVLCLVLQSERQDFILDVTWTLPLASNFQPIFEHHTYWDQVSSIRYLTHLWSLCTELQYYLMAPLIHLCAFLLPFSLRILGYSIAIVVTFLFQVLTPFELSYCFLASRVWQFLMGSVAFELSKRIGKEFNSELDLKKKQKKKKKFTVADAFPSCFWLILMAALMFPRVFRENLIRLIMTSAAAILCFFCAHSQLESSSFTLSPLVFIGNISYVIYLVHWPVINFVRYVQQKDHSDLSIIEASGAITIILALSLLVHYCIEKPVLRLDFFVNFLSSVTLFGLCYGLIPLLQTQECYAIKTLSPTVRERALFNLNPANQYVTLDSLPCEMTQTSANFTFDMLGIEYCTHTGNGTETILVIGNSVASRAFPTIFKLFEGRYKEIRLFLKHGSAPLLNHFAYYTDAAVKMTEEMRPDLLWIIQGVHEIYFHSDRSPTDFSSTALDRVVQREMDRLKVLADKVYVDLPHYVTSDYPAKLMARTLIYRKDLEKKMTVEMEEVDERIGEQSERLLALNCTNCEYIDVQKVLTNEESKLYLYQKDTYKVINYDGAHLSLAAFDYIGPVYQKKINQFLNTLQSLHIK
ncbi:unnamed protein product [Caenorhabditis sp. 36 PRJEB53466]|nr:unnamed protein product [Caenorhabditis sp. 36 PRJEB53466]